MTALFQFRILVLGAATAMLVGIALLSWRFRPKPGSRPLAALMGAATVWAIGSICSLLSVSYAGNLLATYVAYLGVSLVPVAWVFLSLEYAGKEAWTSRRTAAVLLAVPLATQVVGWTNGVHELLWRIDGVVTVGSYRVLEISSYGPWFWVHTLYAYLLMVVGTVVFLRSILRSQRIYRRQVAMVVAAIAIPWAGNAITLSGWFPLVTDPTPFLFVFSGVLFVAALFRFRLLDLAPIARATVMEDMSDGVVVLGHDDYVVDVNPAAGSLLGIDAEAVVGVHAEDLFPPRYVERYRDVYDRSETVVADFPDGQRVLDLRISPLHGHDGELRGRVVIIRDVTTEREQREQLERRNAQLKRQNDHLERFASIVSHDLRNPLSVAQSYADLLREEYDDEYVDRIATAHGEMRALIEDLLTLAREGRMVGETEPVPLAAAANAALSMDEGDVGVELDVGDYAVEASPGRLQQLFENLFGNAAEHAGPDVTVRVGTLADESGFYVADDGPGIPPDERDQVFDSGYTRGSSGTGLGLAIVASIANAHGWDVSVTESEDGGARFEITTDG